MARQPLSRIIPNLLHDSGPPLYYFLARIDSVVVQRWTSLIFATTAFLFVMKRSLLSGALLALYPPAVLFAVDARAYALCALFVTTAVMALDDEHPWAAAVLLVLAAYSHYYGVLFFPVLLFGTRYRVSGTGGSSASGKNAPDTGYPIPNRIREFLLAIVLFLPGFYLALQQPAQALKWNREPLWAPLANLSFAGMYPYALFAAVPVVLVVVALVVLVIGLSGRVPTVAAAVVVPLVLVVAFHVAGRPVYFPMRFESVIAGPLVLWLGSAQGRVRQFAAVLLIAIGAMAVSLGGVDHLGRPLDPYREAALMLRGTREPVVATGYLYLETVVALNRPVIAWPAEQAQHPGWRSTARPDPHALPPAPFLWIGERFAPELAALREVKALQPLFVNERALVARTGSLTPPVH